MKQSKVKVPRRACLECGVNVLSVWCVRVKYVQMFECCSSLYSSVVERQSCKLKVLGSIPSGGLLMPTTALSFGFGCACGIHDKHAVRTQPLHDCFVVSQSDGHTCIIHIGVYTNVLSMWWHTHTHDVCVN